MNIKSSNLLLLLSLVLGLLSVPKNFFARDSDCFSVPMGMTEEMAVRAFRVFPERSEEKILINNNSDHLLLQLYIWAILIGETQLFDVQPDFDINDHVGKSLYLDAVLWLVAHDPISKSFVMLSDENGENLFQRWSRIRQKLDPTFVVAQYHSRWSLFGLEKLSFEEINSYEFGKPAIVSYALAILFEEEGKYLEAYEFFVKSFHGGYARSLLGLLRIEREYLSACSKRGEVIRFLALRDI